MKKIILVRHAKSGWPIGIEDHQRPLLNRGIADAQFVAGAARTLDGSESVIFSSTARRARETALIFAAGWGVAASAINFEDAMYTFGHDKLQHFIGTIPDEVEKAFIFGHNEAITDFVNKFGNIYIDNVPTSGLVELLLPTDSWHQPVRGTTGTVIFPKDLKHGQHDL